MSLTEAVAQVQRWLNAPNITLLPVTNQHWIELAKLDWTGPAVSDAHRAALALAHGCELHTNDTDFAHCPGLRWKNPLIP